MPFAYRKKDQENKDDTSGKDRFKSGKKAIDVMKKNGPTDIEKNKAG